MRTQATPRPIRWPRFLAWLLAAFVIGFACGQVFARSSPSSMAGKPARGLVTPSGKAPSRVAPAVIAVAIDEGLVRASVSSADHESAITPSGAGVTDGSAVLVSSSGPLDYRDPYLAIEAAAIEFGQDPARLIAVAYCESTFRPEVIDGRVRGDGGRAVGLWQFHEATFRANARRLYGHDVGDLRADVVVSSRVAAWMWSIGQSGQWSCAK